MNLCLTKHSCSVSTQVRVREGSCLKAENVIHVSLQFFKEQKSHSTKPNKTQKFPTQLNGCQDKKQNQQTKKKSPL